MRAENVISTPEPFDEDGLIHDFMSWSESLGETLARDAGIGQLTEAQWKIIRAMREHYAKFGSEPAMYRLCCNAGTERKQVNELFGHCLVAWRVAGLPNPGEEGKSYLSSI